MDIFSRRLLLSLIHSFEILLLVSAVVAVFLFKIFRKRGKKKKNGFCSVLCGARGKPCALCTGSIKMLMGHWVTLLFKKWNGEVLNQSRSNDLMDFAPKPRVARHAGLFIVKKKTTGYARSIKKAMFMRSKIRKRKCKERKMVENMYEYRN